MEKRPHLELVSVDGDPAEEERARLIEAVTLAVEAERRAARGSLWARMGRANSRRLGNLDYRDRFAREDAWRLSARLPFGGREYPGRNGRGDTK